MKNIFSCFFKPKKIKPKDSALIQSWPITQKVETNSNKKDSVEYKQMPPLR